jgi:6-pyruvoyltetrahydropterin/6-carboxytetrahydropterin synthase
VYALIIKLRDFSAAHRLIKGYQGKCNHLHGHNYSLNIKIGATALDDSDLVLDFKIARKACDRWVQENIDHTTLVCEEDASLIEFLNKDQQRYFPLPGGKNTTVEAVAAHLFSQFSTIIEKENQQHKNNIALLEVELWESKTSAAVYSNSQVLMKGDICGA